ncbi:flavin reductase family protein [Leeia oryzae]|uniref:flavin reductase family protein n=1 Tax=Leeia oryzae TaxID=356662 RepID=UPI00038079AA|nr:flavin reductase family protein [Leeia oryzae]
MRIPVPLAKAYRLLNHGPVTLVTSAHAGKHNVMAAAWAMALDFDKLTVVIDKSAFSRTLMEASGEFVINIPARGLARAVVQVGNSNGECIDKFSTFGLSVENEPSTEIPLVSGCAAWVHCKIIPEPHNQQTYDLFIGEIVNAWADDQAFKDGHWSFADENLKTLHYVAGGAFYVTGESLNVEL